MKVFISYAEEDLEIAIRLRDDIKKTGVETWLAHDNLSAGQNLKTEVNRAISKCDNFIMLLSRKALSKKGFIHKEHKIALDIFDEQPKGKIFIIPVRLDECESPDTRLNNLYAVDLFPLYDKGLSQILRTLGVGVQTQQKDDTQITRIKPVVTGRRGFHPLITFVAIWVIAILTLIIIFKYFPKEAENIKGNYFTTILLASVVFTVLMFTFTKVYVTITKLYANIQIILIPFVLFCIMSSVGSASYLLKKPVIDIIERISDPVITIIKNIKLNRSNSQPEKKDQRKGESQEPVDENKKEEMSIHNGKKREMRTPYPQTTPPTPNLEMREFIVRFGAYMYLVKHDYIDNGNGTITDYATGLMWQKSGTSDVMPYKEAGVFIKELNEEKFAGCNNWRLPTLEELTTLVTKQKQTNGLHIDPIFDAQQVSCWTSNQHKFGGGWYVSFSGGGISCDLLNNEDKYVRAVRSIR